MTSTTQIIAQGSGKYRVLADGWLADVEIFWADGSEEWACDVLATNSALPEYRLADLCLELIRESF